MYYPCNRHDKANADLCYRYMSQYFLMNNDYNATETFEKCDGIEDPVFVGWCYKGTGSHLAKEYFHDVDRTIELCSIGDEKYGNTYCKNIDSQFQDECSTRMNQILDSKIINKHDD